VNGTLANSGAITNTPAAVATREQFHREEPIRADPLFNGRVDDLIIFNQALSRGPGLSAGQWTGAIV
jgi:hypothetical protein